MKNINSQAVFGNIRGCFLAFAFFACLCSIADNKAANEKIHSAFERLKDKNYKSAASDFLDAEHLADDTFIKARAVKMATECYRNANLKYKEFQCLETLINSYPTHIDYPAAVDREFELGDLFYQGERDPFLGFIPWADDVDRTRTVYEAALKHGPFADRAPAARLRLGRIYADNMEVEKSLEKFREVIKMYPGTRAQKYAYLELADILVQLSDRGDGDGKHSTEALQVLKQIKSKYKDAPELRWVDWAIMKVKDNSAERLYNVARFYHRIGRSEPAVRYLNDVIRKFPKADAAPDSELLLASIDSEYKMPLKKRQIPIKHQLYDRANIPVQASPVLIVPENSGGKWLLPIRDLELGEIKKLRDDGKDENK